MKRVSLFLVVLLMVMGATTAFGADFYVCAERGGAARSADGSKERPWRDLQVALDRASAGNTIHIAQGNYLGTSDRGFLQMTTPVNLRGGYSSDFSQRDVLRFRTMIQPPASTNMTARSMALLTLGNGQQFNPGTPGVTIDGIIFDRGFSNGYSPTRGKPPGVDTGMLIHPPGQGENGTERNVATIVMPLLQFPNSCIGNLTIQNCTFINGANYAIRGGWWRGKITIRNNVFVANAYAAVEIAGATGQSQHSYMTEVDFTNNTVLLSWSRTNDLGDMGYGYRFMTGANTDVRNCLIGLSTLAGLDRTRVDSTPADAAKRKTGAEDNAFFMNRKGDLYIASGGGQMVFVKARNFEDREELHLYERNIELPADQLRGKINEAYLTAFININYTESIDYDPNSPANQARRALGLNQVATRTNNPEMYGNRYPLEDALKLFGAVARYGAQAIRN